MVTARALGRSEVRSPAGENGWKLVSPAVRTVHAEALGRPVGARGTGESAGPGCPGGDLGTEWTSRPCVSRTAGFLGMQDFECWDQNLGSPVCHQSPGGGNLGGWTLNGHRYGPLPVPFWAPVGGECSRHLLARPPHGVDLLASSEQQVRPPAGPARSPPASWGLSALGCGRLGERVRPPGGAWLSPRGALWPGRPGGWAAGLH